MSFTYRIRIHQPSGARIQSEGHELVVASPGGSMSIVGEGDKALKDSTIVVLRGTGFPTADEAHAAGTRARAAAQAALASVRIGADFAGRRPTGGGFNPAIMKRIDDEHGTVTLKDVHGEVIVYNESDHPLFIRTGTAAISGGVHVDQLVEAFDAAASVGELTGPQQVAYDLFASSFDVAANADSRFLLLMMAVEALIDRERRPAAVVAFLNELIEQTNMIVLPADDEPHRASLLGALGDLRDDSISRSGRRLASTLGDRTYGDEDPSTFFAKCYSIRSELAHGNTPLPDLDEVRRRGAQLEVFVSDLMSASLFGSP